MHQSSLLILVSFLFLLSCKEGKSPKPQLKETAPKAKKEHKDQRTPVDPVSLINKVFEYGHQQHLTDSCVFLFECDCCAAELAFNDDSSFIYLEHCMSDLDVRIGSFSLHENQLHLHFDALCVSKEYNYENEVDTSAVDYFITDTLLKQTILVFEVAKCNDKTLLIEENSEYRALEYSTGSSDVLSYIEQEGILEHLQKSKVNRANDQHRD
jgi:hypothetical protein